MRCAQNRRPEAGWLLRAGCEGDGVHEGGAPGRGVCAVGALLRRVGEGGTGGRKAGWLLRGGVELALWGIVKFT